MEAPGAVTSGFSALSPVLGPPELKGESAPKPGFATFGVAVTVTGVPSAASRVAPSDAVTPRNGTATPWIGPSIGARASVSLTIRTAAAPAAAPSRARSPRAQVPRRVTTMSPGCTAA